MNIWDTIAPKHGKGGFTISENWGDWEKMDNFTLWLIYRIRILAGWPVIIHCGFDTKGHSNGSKHYEGKAIDFHFKTHVMFANQVCVLKGLLRQLGVDQFTGLGVYQDWNSPGFHLDTRGWKARW